MQEISSKSQKMETEKIPRSQILESTLELGRNWALAVAIASAGWIARGTETVIGHKNWEIYLFVSCILIAMAWVIIAVIRFDEVITYRIKGKRWPARALATLLYVSICALGIGVVYITGKYAENNEIVKICTEAENRQGSKIPTYRECQRLREIRISLMENLEGKSQSNSE